MKYALDKINALLHPTYPTETCCERERERRSFNTWVNSSREVVSKSAKSTDRPLAGLLKTITPPC